MKKLMILLVLVLSINATALKPSLVGDSSMLAVSNAQATWATV